jgi:STE24 endopeptidase
MNPFFLVVLISLLAEFILGLVADLLNLRALRLELPAAFEGLYKPEEYRKSQEYTRITTRFGLVMGTSRLVGLLAFWFSGGFNYLDRLVRAWGFVPLVNGLLYIGILGAAYGLLSLPFNVYATFVIEQRFGFNRTTPRTFWLDRLKGLALGVLIGAPLLAAILSLFQYSGVYAWLYCWAAVTVFSLAMQFVAPTWIMPLFNRFKPMEAGALRDAIFKYASSVNYQVKNVFVMDGSKRSSRANAFFTGFGQNKRIALFDTLIARLTVPELVAVLAHEIGHYKKRHVIQGMIISILYSGLIFYLLSVFLESPGLYQAFYLQQASVYTGLIFFSLFYTPVQLLLSMGMHVLSRRNEYQADRFAAETVDEPQSMVDALKKLSANNLSNLTPHPFYVFLNYSHPPLFERIRSIERAAQLRPAPDHSTGQ